MAQTSSGSKGTPFLDEQRETKRAKEHNHSTTNLKNQTSISMARNEGNNLDETTQVQDSNVDRISNLPHSIILHILSLLPTVDVVQTSLISKLWRHLWNSVPALEFCDFGVEEQKFYNLVNEGLEHRMIGKRCVNDLGISRFKLEMHHYGGSSVDVDRWLSFAVQQHLEELVLLIQAKIFYYEDVNFTLKVLLNSPNLESANIKLDYDGLRKKIDMNWYVDMIDFLSYFNCSKVVSLYYSEENLMFPERLRKFCRSPWSNVKHLKVETRCELKSESLLREALLWLSPRTQTLSIRSEENKARS